MKQRKLLFLLVVSAINLADTTIRFVQKSNTPKTKTWKVHNGGTKKKDKKKSGIP
jgi:hypothetical protein